MRTHSPRFARAVVKSHKLASRVDILFNRQVIIGGEGSTGINISDGEISFDRTAAIMARASLTVAEPTRLPTADNGGPLSPYGYEAQLWRGIEYADGTKELLSQGVFPIQRSQFDGVTLVGQLDLLDRSKQVQDALLEDNWLVAGGTNLGTAIHDLIDAGVPGLTYAFQSTPYTTPAVLFTTNDGRWDAARALAKSCGCEVYFDGIGRCVLREEPGAQADPVIEIVEGDGGTLVSVNLILDREPTFNRVTVTSSNSSTSEVYRGVATDDDPASPTYYFGPFGPKPMPPVELAAISSNEQASAAARAVLMANIGIGRMLEISAVPNPALEPGDVGLARRLALGVNELYIIDGYTMGMKATSVMGMGADVWTGR